MSGSTVKILIALETVLIPGSDGICDDCPIYYESDGYECFDTRTHCYEMSCFGECAEFESGGVCEPCPFGFNGDGHHCWEKCDEIQCFNDACSVNENNTAACDPCPEYFIGNGTICIDIRTHCDELLCFDGCVETAVGGICNPCPDGYEGDGTV